MYCVFCLKHNRTLQFLVWYVTKRPYGPYTAAKTGLQYTVDHVGTVHVALLLSKLKWTQNQSQST